MFKWILENRVFGHFVKVFSNKSSKYVKVFLTTSVGMSLDWVDFNSSKFIISLIILIISFKVIFLNGNVKATSDGTCFLFRLYLGRFQIFLIAFNTGSWWRVIYGGRWISKFDTIFVMYSFVWYIFHIFQLMLSPCLLMFHQLHMVSLFFRITYCLLHV